MLESSYLATPMEVNEKPSSSDNELVDASTIHSLIRALQYLMFTRLDIIYVVNRVRQHFSTPTLANFQAIKCILRYLKRTQDYEVHYIAQSPPSLYAFSDAD